MIGSASPVLYKIVSNSLFSYTYFKIYFTYALRKTMLNPSEASKFLNNETQFTLQGNCFIPLSSTLYIISYMKQVKKMWELQQK